MGDLFQPWHLIVLSIASLFGLVIFVIPYSIICRKAGFSPWLTLLNLVPLGNIILVLFLAYSDWKIPPPTAPQPPMSQG